MIDFCDVASSVLLKRTIRVFDAALTDLEPWLPDQSQVLCTSNTNACMLVHFLEFVLITCHAKDNVENCVDS